MDALQAYLDAYFEARRKMDGKACKGEEECGEKGRPDGQRGLKGYSGDVEAICGKCPFAPMKPSNLPLRVSSLVMIAYRMEAILGDNPGSIYPNFYTPLEWESFLTLKHCRAKADEKDLPATPKTPQVNPAMQAALGARVKR